MGKKKTLRDHAGTLADTLAPHVENARDEAASVLTEARVKAAPYVAEARDKVAPYVAEARDKVAPLVADARDKAGPYVADARDKAAPVLSEARDKAAPFVSDARDRINDRFTSDVLPALTAALAAVDEATEDVRAETGKRSKAVAAALKGEVEAPGKTHRVRNVLVVLGLGGLLVAVAKKLSSRQPTTSWQSAYTPPPAPTTSPAAGPVGAGTGAHRADGADDVAASDPAEAASDAADAPHDASTPDNPVTEIDIEKQ